MKVLVIGFGDGTQWQLFFDGELPEVPKTGFVHLPDDYGQVVEYTADAKTRYLIQDTDGIDRAQVAMMIRQKLNEMQAIQQLQASPQNMILRPPGLMS
jgi:hypothetical protein